MHTALLRPGPACVVGNPTIAAVQRSLAAKFADVLPIRILKCPLPVGMLIQNLRWHGRNDNDPAHVFMRQCLAAAAAKLGLPVRSQL